MTSRQREQIWREKFKDDKYREAFAEAHLRRGTAFKIRELSKKRGWNQEDVAKAAGLKQGTVSRLLDPNYGRFTLSSILKMASALDMAVNIEFISFSELGKRLSR